MVKPRLFWNKGLKWNESTWSYKENGYNQIHSFYDIVNDALKWFRDYTVDISDANAATHKNKEALRYCKEGLSYILEKRDFEWFNTKIDLAYSAGNNFYDLSLLNANGHKVNEVYRYNELTGKYEELTQKRIDEYEKFIAYDPDKTGKPETFTLNYNELYLYPTPDKDYDLTVDCYPTYEITDFKALCVLPSCFNYVLKYYIASQVALKRSDEKYSFFNKKFVDGLSVMTYQDSNDLSSTTQMPMNINFGRS